MSGPADGAFCFNMRERTMPFLRAETARRLGERGLRQVRIAEHLGVSQAMVSKYLRARPRPPPGFPIDRLQAVVARAVASALEGERQGRLPAWCPLCPEAWTPGPAGAVGTELEECLRGEAPRPTDASQEVLDDARAAATRIRRLPFARLAPEVSVNLAVALVDARDPRGVAAFPGRFAEVSGELRPVAEPEFGASRHLSEVLLQVRRHRPDLRAVACLRAGDDVRRAARAARLHVEVLPRRRGELVVGRAVAASADALVDPGAFGIEPITYLFGATAVDVVDKAARILEALPKGTP